MGATVAVAVAGPTPALAGYPALIECLDGVEGPGHATFYDEVTLEQVAGPLPVCTLVPGAERSELTCPDGEGPCVLVPGIPETEGAPYAGVDLLLDVGLGGTVQRQNGCTLAVCLSGELPCTADEYCPLGGDGELGPCIGADEEGVCAEPIEANEQLRATSEVVLPPLCMVAFDVRCDGEIDSADIEILHEAAADGGTTSPDAGLEGGGAAGVLLTGGGMLSCECTASSVAASRRASGFAVSFLALLVALALRASRRGARDRTARRRTPDRASVSR